MRVKHIVISIGCGALIFFSCPAHTFITTKPANGRFGDHLVLYARAKLISLACNAPLLYQPFSHSEGLVLHAQETLYNQDAHKNLPTIELDDAVQILGKAVKNNPALYRINFFTRLRGIQSETYAMCLREIRRLIRPSNTLATVTIPPGTLSVAVHVRRGGGYDHLTKHVFREKFLPASYYAKALRSLMKLFPHRQIYAHIFTDDPNPNEVVSEISAALNNRRVKFGYRKEKNRYAENVLEDFFAMTKFDCLVRPASSFSRMAEVLGNHRVVISPSGMKKNQDPIKRLERVLAVNPLLHKVAGIPDLLTTIPL